MTEKLQNAIASLEVDLEGGAITSFEMIDQRINPLEFSFSEEQMPENNRAGAPYKGHFICLGRWGSPSAGEIQKGVPHHGQFANMVWKTESRHSLELQMSASSELEGLAVQREIQMHPHSPVVAVKETVENFLASWVWQRRSINRPEKSFRREQRNLFLCHRFRRAPWLDNLLFSR